MDLLNNPSDDHIAAIGCVLAFVVSGGLMYVSFFVGQIGQKSEKSDTVRFETALANSQQNSDSDRKAA
ncbi:MAG: hypothetical protein O2820_19260 [Planctomycetota bacterium]|nr:hypothetical protein [Planctomycetota bacterium]MDA1251354.1 hypothetical protein [Planctomycetota bacterium]